MPENIERKRRAYVPRNQNEPKKVFVLLSDASVKDKIVDITLFADDAADAMAEGRAVAAKTQMVLIRKPRKQAAE